MSRGGHGAYRLWLCVSCGFALPANKWARHRRACARTSECPTCRRSFPCRTQQCPKREVPIHVEKKVPGAAPTHAVVESLDAEAERRTDGSWSVRVPWLEDAVIGATWEDAYWECRARRRKQ